MNKSITILGIMLALGIAVVSLLISTDVIKLEKTTGAENPPTEQEMTYDELKAQYAQLQQEFDLLQGKFDNDINNYLTQIEDMQLSYDQLQEEYNSLESMYYEYVSNHPNLEIPTNFATIVIDLSGYSFGGGEVGNEGDNLTIHQDNDTITYLGIYRDNNIETVMLTENTRSSNLVEYIDNESNSIIRIIATSQNYVVEFVGTVGEKEVNVIFESVTVVESGPPSIVG